MARTPIAIKDANANSATPANLGAGATAADAGNDMMFPNVNGNVLLFVITIAASGADISIVGVADPYGRTETLGPSTVGASVQVVFGPFAPGLFTQPSGADVGQTYVNVDNVSGTVSLQGLRV